MSFEFTDEHIQQIGRILGVEAKHYGNHYRYEIKGSEPERRVSLELYPRIAIGEEEGTLVSVFTPNSNLQLQHCSGIVMSELMGEVTFFAEAGGKMSGLIVEKEGGCSLYANVNRSMLSGDFTKLGPEVMLSGIALSLTELMLEETDDEEEAPPEA
ncbi:MAG: hypothetical protein C0600_04660 [Ignavibacteria bacterium]|nr:MAG: hypothetical protein C0600_04660 [Ignavibacteria bacterium]